MEKYLGQCLDSLLVPSVGDVEILVINDGSKDRTSEIAHEYSQRYPQSIRVIDKFNGHYGSCINRGLNEATGKYVKILDADDSFDSEVFERFIEFLKDTDADLVLSNYCIVNENRVVTDFRSITGSKVPDKNYQFSETIDLLTSKFMAMHGVCYRRDMLLSLGYTQTEGVPYTDQEWIFEPMTKVKIVSVFPKYLYRYLVGREGQSISGYSKPNAIALQLNLIGKRVKIYNDVQGSISNVQAKYLSMRLMCVLKNTYHTILLNNDLRELLPNLSKLDASVRQASPKLYQALGNVWLKPWLPIKYIKRWRKTSNNKI